MSHITSASSCLRKRDRERERKIIVIMTKKETLIIKREKLQPLSSYHLQYHNSLPHLTIQYKTHITPSNKTSLLSSNQIRFFLRSIQHSLHLCSSSSIILQFFYYPHHHHHHLYLLLPQLLEFHSPLKPLSFIIGTHASQAENTSFSQKLHISHYTTTLFSITS